MSKGLAQAGGVIVAAIVVLGLDAPPSVAMPVAIAAGAAAIFFLSRQARRR